MQACILQHPTAAPGDRLARRPARPRPSVQLRPGEEHSGDSQGTRRRRCPCCTAPCNQSGRAAPTPTTQLVQDPRVKTNHRRRPGDYGWGTRNGYRKSAPTAAQPHASMQSANASGPASQTTSTAKTKCPTPTGSLTLGGLARDTTPDVFLLHSSMQQRRHRNIY